MRDIIRLSVSEAARLFGLSSLTIRRALAQGHLRYVVVHGRYKISFESLVAWSQQFVRVRNKRDRTGIGQFVSRWKIKNTLFSPNPTAVQSSAPHEESAAQDMEENKGDHSTAGEGRATV